MKKQKNLYLPNGYWNFKSALDDDCPFAFVIGGRATGKTFGALEGVKDHFDNTGRTFIYLRRTKTQADLMATDVFNPFRPINTLRGWNVQPFPVARGVTGYYNEVDEDDKLRPAGSCMGVNAALTTFSNFRGFDASNLDFVIYDEFIKNRGEKSIRDEGYALLNVYETVNRNRELYGANAVKMMCLSNANTIANDVFLDLNLADKVEHMRKIGKNQYYDLGRGIAIYDLSDSDISKRKKDTALYRMDDGGTYSDMALGNQYADYDTAYIESQPLQEYKPIAVYDNICIYRHKSDRRYYVTSHRSGTAPAYKATDVDRSRFIKSFGYLWDAYIDGCIRFDCFSNVKKFESIYK